MQEFGKQRVFFEDLGQMDYPEAWAYQTEVHRALVARKREFGFEKAPSAPRHRLIFVEHDPVYTLGKSGSAAHLLLDEAGLKAKGVKFHKINRGGDITFHGPGQLVGYPIFDLDWFFNDVKRYVWSLEEAIILTLAEYGLKGERYAGYTGVWLSPKPASDQFPLGLPWRKICAIGVHLSRWVTLHGFAFNINTDLSYFRGIVPCGIASGTHEVTTLEFELGMEQVFTKVAEKVKFNLAKVFDFEFEQDT